MTRNMADLRKLHGRDGAGAPGGASQGQSPAPRSGAAP